MAAAGGPGSPAERIQTFRSFATQLAGQVVEQLCQEFEREVGTLWGDVLQYRQELGRVAELLGNQLTRERSLHDMLESMAGHHVNIANSAHMVAQQSTPNSKQLHEMVDQLMGQHSSAVQSTLQGVSQAHAIAQTHASQAKALQEPLISAENEYNRICSLLSQPMISAAPSLEDQRNAASFIAEPIARPGTLSASVARTPPMTPPAPQRPSPISSMQVPSVGRPQSIVTTTSPAVGVYSVPALNMSQTAYTTVTPPQQVVAGPPIQMTPVHMAPSSVVMPMLANGMVMTS